MERPRLPLLLACWLSACTNPSASHAESRADIRPPARFGTEIATPRVLEGLPIGLLDVAGRATVAPCGTCHAGQPKTLPETALDIGGPHVGLSMHHGELRCAACHAPDARDELRLADGRTIPLTAAMQLCSQCHGSQKRDYDHGAHGGMRGYWDLSRGPRERNHCVSCHDPHAPKFGGFMPVEGPRDRFSGPESDDSHDR